PRYVVSTQTASDGLGGSFATNFQYNQARAHRWGRGFLGFRKVTAKDMRNQVSVETTYNQNPSLFPWLGLPANVLVKQSDNTPISETTNTYGIYFTTNRYAAALTKQVVKQYEVEGAQN